MLQDMIREKERKKRQRAMGWGWELGNSNIPLKKENGKGEKI